ncbi:hypothetical protein [Alkalihalobacillus deserti]|nr:hypothetical protein [Alkalihalobacillus deserti]
MVDMVGKTLEGKAGKSSKKMAINLENKLKIESSHIDKVLSLML